MFVLLQGSEGPSATSFENPRKVGWLSKHGGSGVSSHWKKRWFIVDHHYLFYYKGPNVSSERGGGWKAERGRGGGGDGL